MSRDLTGFRPIDSEGYGNNHGTDFGARDEISPEEQAAKSVDAIWSAHAAELEKAMRKMPLSA